MLLCALLAVLATGCGGDDDQATGDTTQSASADVEAPEVRVITQTSPQNSSWERTRAEEYEAAAEENGWNLEVAESVGYGNADQVLEQWGEEGVDVVFSTDSGYSPSMIGAAEKFPDTAWVTMSALPDPVTQPNVASYSNDWCEYGYVQGLAAGAVSETGVVGGIGGIDILPAQQTAVGIQSGLDVAHPGGKFDIQYTGDFVEAQPAQTTTAGLIGQDADVVMSVLHAAAPQIAAEAQRRGVSYLGTFADESEYAPDATITSVVIDLAPYWEEAVSGWMNDEFSNDRHVLGLADGAFRLAPFGESFADAEEEVNALLEEADSESVEYPKGVCTETE